MGSDSSDRLIDSECDYGDGGYMFETTRTDDDTTGHVRRGGGSCSLNTDYSLRFDGLKSSSYQQPRTYARLALVGFVGDESAGLDRLLDMSWCTCGSCPCAFNGILLYANTPQKNVPNIF